MSSLTCRNKVTSTSTQYVAALHYFKKLTLHRVIESTSKMMSDVAESKKR